MRPMSPLAPFRKWTLSAGIAIALVLTLPLVGLPSVAHADLGDEPSSKSSGGSQVEDNDKPKDSSLLEKKPADAAVAQQKQAPVGPPFYEKWQFWVISAAVLVGVGALIWGGIALNHTLNGGDVRPCNTTFMDRCYGEGH
jgi:hypothetical protein